MQIVTLNLPNIYIATIKKLMQRNPEKYPSRSEVVRMALREFLIEELKMVQIYLEITSNEDLNKKQLNEQSNTKKSAIRKIDMRTIRSGWNFHQKDLNYKFS